MYYTYCVGTPVCYHVRSISTLLVLTYHVMCGGSLAGVLSLHVLLLTLAWDTACVLRRM